MVGQVICKLCSAASHLKFNIKGYVQHLRLFHAHQADFRTVCGISGCPRSFTNFGTFINHVYSVLSGSSRADCEVISGNNGTLVESHEDESCEHKYDGNHATEQDDDYESRQPTNDLDNQQMIWTTSHVSPKKCCRNLQQPFAWYKGKI